MIAAVVAAGLALWAPVQAEEQLRHVMAVECAHAAGIADRREWRPLDDPFPPAAVVRMCLASTRGARSR